MGSLVLPGNANVLSVVLERQGNYRCSCHWESIWRFFSRRLAQLELNEGFVKGKWFKLPFILTQSRFLRQNSEYWSNAHIVQLFGRDKCMR